MRRFSKWCGRALLGGLASLNAGCGSGAAPVTPDRPMDGISLTDVGEAYRVYSLHKGKPPQKLSDLQSMEQVAPAGVLAAKRGDIVVHWGAALSDTGEEPGANSSDEVLAYQKEVPAEGGYVLTLDRRVKKLTADEFKAAPKPAGTKLDDKTSSKKK
jgi:hypothetical protein